MASKTFTLILLLASVWICTVNAQSTTTTIVPTTSATTTSSSASMSTPSLYSSSMTPTMSSSSTVSPTKTVSPSSSSTKPPPECTKANPECDKDKCCLKKGSSWDGVKKTDIPFGTETCINMKFVNTTACANICTIKQCSHGNGLTLPLATIIASFMMFWSMM